MADVDASPVVRERDEPPLRYRAIERVVGLAELEPFLDEALEQADASIPAFAVFHGRVDESTRSRVEVGLPDPTGDRELDAGRVVYARGPRDAGYDEIHVAYDAIQRHIVAHGYRQRGPTREVYLADAIEVVWPIA